MRDIDRFNLSWSARYCGHYAKGAPDACRLWKSSNFRFKGITASRWIYSYSVRKLNRSDTLFQVCRQRSCVNLRHMVVRSKEVPRKIVRASDESYYDRRKRIGGGVSPVLCRNFHVVEDDGASQCRDCNRDRQRNFRDRNKNQGASAS